jgi:hypothetical protein
MMEAVDFNGRNLHIILTGVMESNVIRRGLACCLTRQLLLASANVLVPPIGS